MSGPKNSAMQPEQPRTSFQKLWDQHVVTNIDEQTDLLHIDRLLLHELTGSVTFRQIGVHETKPAMPTSVFSFVDHLIATEPGRGPEQSHADSGPMMIRLARETSKRHGFTFIGGDDPRQGIVHVVAPELGIVLPGMSVVCSDSHTCTLGGIGALAWGIGSTECRHVAASQVLIQSRPRTLRVNIDGQLPVGVSIKDIILHLIGLIGAKGGDGYAIEYAGSTVRAMSIDQRLTLCNMTIEMSSKYGMVAVDDKAIDYFAGREFAPKGAYWDSAVTHWHSLVTDPDARFDREIYVNASALSPMVTWGISPEHVAPIDHPVPESLNSETSRALDYIKLPPGQLMTDVIIDVAYIGSCTNGRLDDLREAAAILGGRTLAPGVIGICVPGSSSVKRAAETEGLDVVFKQAGFEWHESGCGFCAYLGNERLRGKRVISTTNRNFENRQGVGTCTHLGSAATVAASALAGRIADPRPFSHS